jgi:hypothetical protein
VVDLIPVIHWRINMANNINSYIYSADDNLVNQHPAVRALQILGYPLQDISRAVLIVQRKRKVISAELLLDTINNTEHRPASLGSGVKPLQVDVPHSSNTVGTSTDGTGLVSSIFGNTSKEMVRFSDASTQTLNNEKTSKEMVRLSDASTQTSKNEKNLRAIPPRAKPGFMVENERLKKIVTCKVCLGTVLQTAFLPCRHCVCCQKCAYSLRNCPLCRKRILGTVRVYLV